MTTRNTADRGFAPLAGGYLPQLADNAAGFVAQTVNGCRATWGGFAGGWDVILEDTFSADEMTCYVNGAPGSEVGGSVTDIGVGNVGPGHFSFHMQRLEVVAADNVTITNFSVPLWFQVWKRPSRT